MSLYIAGAVAALLLVAPGADGHARARCHAPRRARVLASSSQALVWTRRYRTHRFGRVQDWVGCARSSRRRLLLDELAGASDPDKGDPTPMKFRLSGSDVAFTFDTHTYVGGGHQYVKVVDLRRRRVVLQLPVYDFGAQNSPTYRFDELAVSARGHVAWLQEGGENMPQSVPPLTLSAHDSRGTRQLDNGALNSITGVRIAGETVHWLKDGMARSAPLG